MDEDESTERRMQMALLYQRLAKMKQQLNDDDTEYINQAISSKSPDTCWTLLTNLEKKGNLQMDPGLLGKLMDIYARVFSSLPLRLHAHDLSYAKMLIRFAELNAIQEVSDAQANFEKARSHCGEFAFVHVSYAQFELSRGNIEKCSLILQNGLEKNAKPRHILDSAVKNLNVGKHQLLLPEDKENREEREGLRSDGAWDHWSSNSSISLRSVLKFSPQDENVTVGRAASHLGRPSVALRVPMVPLSIPQNKSSESEGLHKSEAASPIPVRQAQNSSIPSKIPMGTSRKATPDSDSYCSLSLKNPALSPISSRNTEEVDSLTTFLHRPEHLWMDNSSRMEETTDIHQFISTNSLESCMVFLRNLERSGDPSSDPAILSRLLNFYSRVFTRFPLAKHYKLEGYARMLVRYAELKGIEDPEDAHDEFSIARSYCKAVAFVHVAHAQFELSQGNVRKSRLILHKALDLNAQPVLMLHAALKNLNSGKARLLSEEEEKISENPEGPTNKKEENSARASEGLPKPPVTEPASERKITALLHKQTSPQDQKPLFDPVYTSTSFHSVKAPRPNPAVSYQSPDHRNPNTFLTPVMKQRPVVVSVPSTAQKMPLPQNSKSSSQQPAQTPTPAFSETISIKGRQFFIFKTIGRGGSSKVYQVYDQKKHVYAVKYVNLQEVDAEAVESYKNEIQHLNRLQQYSDQIIKLYDYEITSNYIYMLMECGQLDLNTWLRNRKSVNALDRKCYWRNMLEAVHTIHKHGIIHSDLKPANFVIVDGSLKLIDFGIANRIQPDVTSIMKDSQVGTLNYMPPEAIKDTSSNGKSGSKISPKGDVWSLGCILYCMTYGNTPFQSINNQISKIHSIIDPSHQIPFPDIPEKDLLDVLKRCLVRNPRERISIPELLDHSYLQLQPPPEAADACDNNLKRILNELAALQSPNSIARATSNLAKMCNSGKRLDVSECVKLLDPPTGK